MNPGIHPFPLRGIGFFPLSRMVSKTQAFITEYY